MDTEPYQRRISRRARRLRIDVSARGGVVVVVPEGTPETAVREFVRDKHDWVRRARQRVAANARAFDRPDEPVPDALELRALGVRYTVEQAAADRPRVSCSGDRVRVAGAADEGHARMLLADWLKRRAREFLPQRLSVLASQHGLEYRRVAVRGQRTRWGSCSGRGTISLNYKLLFLPPALVDHVLLHELAHTRHLNHSPRFWRLLARLDPNWRHHHAELGGAARWLPAWAEMDG
ncbi:MAG: SprT family zinc-dependent metalloprotease, partial [Halofilum sp. (in: g-proteobacteria)]